MKESKFKKGDKVRLDINKIDESSIHFYSGLKEYFNSTVYIIQEVKIFVDHFRYYLKDVFDCYFLEDWMVLVEDVKESVEQSFFDKAYASLAKMQNEKDKRYGESALKPLTIFTGKTKVADRLHDKLNRISNSDVLRKNDVADLIGYLMLVCKENGWDDFNDLID